MLSPLTHEAYQLLHDGTEALADVEATGICIDIDYCTRQSAHLQRKIDRLEGKLDKTKEFKLWKKMFGGKFKIDSNPQLSVVLFDKLGYKPLVFTGEKDKEGKPKPSVSQEALISLELPFVDDLIQYRKYNKAKNTYLNNFIKEAGPDGILHPFFHLHTVQTFRSSSANPNWQNIPARDAEIKRLIRRAIKPRKGHHIVEIDYSGIEVKIAACYHRDPTMLKYIHDDSTDMHRDMCQQCYILSDDEWTKMTRYCAKNMFVFPQFYGDYYKSCAGNLWNAIKRLDLKTDGGVGLYDHLKTKGIKTLKQFENHVKKVEEDFWERRFKVYNEWKETHYQRYLKKGYFDLKTGFRCQGIMKRNEVINYPVQGAAFHCLLWSLIRVNKILKQKGFRSCIIGQIHDSLILDAHHEELDEVLRICEQVMCHDLKEHWKWIIVPVGIEAEVASRDASWYRKEEVHERSCKYCGYAWTWKLKDDKNQVYHKCVRCEEEEH